MCEFPDEPGLCCLLHPVPQQIKYLPGHIDSDSPDLKCREIVAHCANDPDQVIENMFLRHVADSFRPDIYRLSGSKFIFCIQYF